MDQIPIVYFCAAVSGDSSLRSTVVRPLIEFIRDDLQLPVLSEHIAYDNHRELLAQKIGKKSADEINEFDIEKQDIAWLDTATHVIAEITCPSIGVGREIEYARTKHHFDKTKARILCIYNHDKKVSAMITGMDQYKYTNIFSCGYANLSGAQYLIRRFILYNQFLPNF